MAAVDVTKKELDGRLRIFKTNPNSNSVLVVKFYSPTCPACQRIADLYDKLAATAKVVNPSVDLTQANVSSRSGAALAKKYKIEHVPTFLVFRGDAAQPLGMEGGSEDNMQTLSNIVHGIHAFA